MSATTIEILRSVIEVINVLFVVYLIGYSTALFASCVIGSISLYDKWQMNELKNNLPNEHFIPVSLIVPSYNEAAGILGTVYSLLDLDYNIFEIIVVNDGSSDNTSEVMINQFNMLEVKRPIRMQVSSKNATSIYEATINGREVTLINKENGGKADALNLGINASKYPYIITIDADTMLDSLAVRNIMSPAMEDDDVIAVGGIVRPANDLKIAKGKVVKPSMPKNVFACMQAFEYDRSFLSSRLLFDKMNATLIISGAFGMYRKKEMIAIGGYHQDTIGEDMELVVKLHSYCKTLNLPYKISYASDAICWTQVPKHITDYVNQRRRWHIGLFQTLMNYRWLLFRRAIGGRLWISFIYYTVYELFSPVIEIIGVLTMIGAVLLGLINLPFMLLFLFVYILFGWILTLVAFFSRINTTNTGITAGDVIRSFLYCLLENTFMRLILSFARLTAFTGYKKLRLRWNKVRRQKVDLYD